MNYTWFLAFSFSVFIAAAIGWVRFKKIAPAFYPFIVCLSLGALNEILSTFLSYQGSSTMVNNNIYVLAESILLVTQLSRWHALGKYHQQAGIIIFLLLITWMAENILLFKLHGISSYFRLIYSAIVVLLSINVSNRLIATEKSNLLKHPVFLVCIGFIIYFTYKILVETFWLYGLGRSGSFRENVYSIMIWINLMVNLIYAFAVLWMPAKQRFTLQY
jgi:hypothetical protein